MGTCVLIFVKTDRTSCFFFSSHNCNTIPTQKREIMVSSCKRHIIKETKNWKLWIKKPMPSLWKRQVWKKTFVKKTPHFRFATCQGSDAKNKINDFFSIKPLKTKVIRLRLYSMKSSMELRKILGCKLGWIKTESNFWNCWTIRIPMQGTKWTIFQLIELQHIEGFWIKNW